MNDHPRTHGTEAHLPSVNAETDADIAAAVTTHEAAPNPHPDYTTTAELGTHETDTSTHGVGEVVGRTETQTLTNKNLTAPTIADFTNAAHDHGDADDGGAIVQAAIPASAIDTTRLADDSVTPNKLALGDDGVIDATSSTTSSATFTDLAAGAGPAVTVTVGASGKVLVGLSAQLANDTAAAFCIMGVDVSGASTIAASDASAISFQQATGLTNQDLQCSRLLYMEGLTAGSTTFTAKYRVSAGTGTFLRREIFAIPL